MFASENTRVKISSHSITTFRKDLIFSANSHCIHDSVFTAKSNESGQRPKKLFSIRFQNKKINLEFSVSWKQWFPAVMINQSPNSGFIEFSRLHSQHYPSVKIKCVKIVLKTATAEASCCFILISGIIDEAELNDTNNKRSLDLGEYTKQRYLNF